MEEKFSNKIKGLESLKGAVLAVEKKDAPLTIEQVEAREKMISSLDSGNIDKALEIIKEYNLPEDMVRANAEKVMTKLLERSYNSYGNVSYADAAVKIKTAFNLLDDVFTAAASEGVFHILGNFNLEDALKFKKTVNLPDSPMLTERIRDIGIDKIRDVLRRGEVEKALELKKAFNISEETVREQAREIAVNELLNGHIDKALKIKAAFNLPESIMSDPKVQSEAKKILIKNFNFKENGVDESINQAIKTISSYKLSEDAVQDAVKEIIIEEAPRYNFSGDFYQAALKIIAGLKLSEDVLKAAAKKGMIRSLVQDWDVAVLGYKSIFKLSEDDVQSAAREAVIAITSIGAIGAVAKIQSRCNLPDSFMSSPEVQAAAQARINRYLVSGEVCSCIHP